MFRKVLLSLILISRVLLFIIVSPIILIVSIISIFTIEGEISISISNNYDDFKYISHLRDK